MTNVLFCQTRFRNAFRRQELSQGNKTTARNAKGKKTRKIGKCGTNWVAGLNEGKAPVLDAFRGFEDSAPATHSF
jgi:hypothetical protein